MKVDTSRGECLHVEQGLPERAVPCSQLLLCPLRACSWKFWAFEAPFSVAYSIQGWGLHSKLCAQQEQGTTEFSAADGAEELFAAALCCRRQAGCCAEVSDACQMHVPITALPVNDTHAVL
eukprot:1143524-Pelagomonas_calceolata.AAC.5